MFQNLEFGNRSVSKINGTTYLTLQFPLFTLGDIDLNSIQINETNIEGRGREGTYSRAISPVSEIGKTFLADSNAGIFQFIFNDLESGPEALREQLIKVGE